MRNKNFSSLQKTYDECYLICSTAVYFESQVCAKIALSGEASCLAFTDRGSHLLMYDY